MSSIRGLKKGSLPEAPATSGISRHQAFKGDDFVVVHASSEPGTVSGWHHHGDYDVYGYVVSGAVRFESGPGGSEATSIGPGDYFHVPAHVVHRDVNPSSAEGQEVVLFLRGSGQMVVNVEGPDPD